ncbi:MAG: hypothetical protein LBG04_00025, partial [Holosporaceae bacterium]|nr:hypothetical protein [Holosporaceae bacterium]
AEEKATFGNYENVANLREVFFKSRNDRALMEERKRDWKNGESPSTPKVEKQKTYDRLLGVNPNQSV